MASRFWVGGTGTWDASDTTHWSATSGGAGGESVPGSADTVTLNGSSGGGTVTVNTTVTVQSIACGAFTGTLDFSVNNNNVTVTASAGFNASGTGTRTINLGNGTWTLVAPSDWNIATTTNLTFNANSSSIVLSGASTESRDFSSSGRTYNSVTFSSNSSGGSVIVSGGTNTFGNLTISGPLYVEFPASNTNTVTNAFTWGGAGSNPVGIFSSADTVNATISVAAGVCKINSGAIRRITFSGGATFSAANSFDLGFNTGITIAPPGPSPTYILGA